MSKKTHFLVAGADAGSKLDKAKALGTTIIDEATLLQMLEGAIGHRGAVKRSHKFRNIDIFYRIDEDGLRPESCARLQGRDLAAGRARQRGSTGLGVAIPQWNPRPGASSERAMGDPIITASAPQAMHLQMSPPVTIPPSATIGT